VQNVLKPIAAVHSSHRIYKKLWIAVFNEVFKPGPPYFDMAAHGFSGERKGLVEKITGLEVILAHIGLSGCRKNLVISIKNEFF
jgi:hypothetical protein